MSSCLIHLVALNISLELNMIIQINLHNVSFVCSYEYSWTFLWSSNYSFISKRFLQRPHQKLCFFSLLISECLDFRWMTTHNFLWSSNFPLVSKLFFQRCRLRPSRSAFPGLCWPRCCGTSIKNINLEEVGGDQIVHLLWRLSPFDRKKGPF